MLTPRNNFTSMENNNTTHNKNTAPITLSSIPSCCSAECCA